MTIDTTGLYKVLVSYKVNGFNEAMVQKHLKGNAYTPEEIDIGLGVFRNLPEPKQQKEVNRLGEDVISLEPIGKWEQFVYRNSEDVTTIWFSSVIIGFILLAVISNKR
jgi:hypothetical protein